MDKRKPEPIRGFRSKVSLFLILILVLNLFPMQEKAGEGMLSFFADKIARVQQFAGNRINTVFADDRDYFFKSGDFTVNLSSGGSSEPFTLSADSATLSLISSEKGNPAVTQPVLGAKINIDNIADEKVAKVAVVSNSSGTGSTGISLTRKGAGSKQISGNVELAGGATYSFNFYVKVDLEIVKTPTTSTSSNSAGYARVFANDTTNNTLYMPVVNKTLQIKLKGYNVLLPDGNLDYSGSQLDWSVDVNGAKNDNSVFEVDPTNGVVKAIGAGVAEIEVAAAEDPTGQVKSAKTMAVVPLKMSVNNAAMGNYDGFTDDVRGATVDLDGMSKTIYTTAFDTNDIEWEVTKDGKKVTDVISFTNAREKTANSASSITIEGKRAGTYDVVATLKKVKGDYKNLQSVRTSFKVRVPLTTASSTIYLNVGDTYNIYNNSNIGSIDEFTYTPDGSGVVRADGSTSVITGLKTGTGVVTVRSKTSATEFTITAVVIDTISLSASNITIPVGGTFDLTAVATNISTSDSWKWVSENTGIASVEGDGVNAVVKGVAAGSTVITVEHTVSGVTKRVSCTVNVTAAVTKITLTPATSVLSVGQITSIKAEVTPKTSTGTYLYWRSSNPAIVQIDDENNHTAVASVTAKAPGVAVIMALNKDNVVLGSATITVNTVIKGITLSETVVERPLSDKTYQLTAVTIPADASNTNFKWTSLNEKIATVDEKGLVTFKAAGQVGIIVASESNPAVMATCNITITKSVEGIKLDRTELSLAVGETYKLTPTLSPADATNQTVTYKSMDSKVATVSNTGLITARQAGNAYIIASTPDGKHQATVTVKVTQKATGMKLSAVSLVLDVGESYTIEATFNPKTTTETKITWSVSDKSIAKVDAKGRVTGVSPGEAIVTATSSNGLTALVSVKVNKPVGSLALSQEELTMVIDEEYELEVIFDSDDVTNQKVSWKSSKSDVASVKDGIVTAKKGGVAIITATADENGMTASCIVTVEEPITEITLDKTAYNLGIRKKVTLKATIDTNSASNRKLVWTSSKTSVATVNKSGVVTGKKAGYANITVKATDGSGASATARIRVVREATSLSVNESFLAMIVGKRKTIKATISPKNATYKTAKFVSDNTDVAMVDSKGRVTALAAGEAKITVSAKDNSGVSQVVVVKAREYIPSTSITLSNTTLTMGVGDTQSTVYSITPNANDDKVTWATNNRAVARVSRSGLITAVAPGAAVITATTTSGRTAQVAVTVVGLNFTSLDMEQYDTYTLSVLGDVSNIIWDSEDPGVATVAGGTVTAKKVGSTYIRARVNGALLRCRVTVREIN